MDVTSPSQNLEPILSYAVKARLKLNLGKKRLWKLYGCDCVGGKTKWHWKSFPHERASLMTLRRAIYRKKKNKSKPEESVKNKKKRKENTSGKLEIASGTWTISSLELSSFAGIYLTRFFFTSLKSKCTLRHWIPTVANKFATPLSAFLEYVLSAIPKTYA